MNAVRVLLVEGELLVAKVLEMTLAEEGPTVAGVARNGREASGMAEVLAPDFCVATLGSTAAMMGAPRPKPPSTGTASGPSS